MKQFKKIIPIILALLYLPMIVVSQQILFDKGVRAGQLTAFPELSNPNNYYYLPDKISVATHPDGKPQFSFIRYVRNVSDPESSGGITESNQAGGVLHVLVSLSIPDEMRKEAEREIQRLNGSAKLMGPVIYKSGKVAVISSIIGTDGEMTKKVVGLGSAPILEGQKAAVSVLLSKEGSDILWATFQTPTPDLSFQFEMDARGYLSPKSVKIEANFEQIYSHKSIEAAAVSPVFAAEIKAAFDELSNSGAIKVTQIGEDADLNKMKETAYNQLVNLMFDKVGGEGAADFNRLLPHNSKSMLDRATEMLTRARTEARQENQRIERAEQQRAEREARARQSANRLMDSIYRARNIPVPPGGDQEGDSDRDRVRRVPVPSFAITASLVLKKVKRTGKYFIDLNKYTEDQRTFPFAENVGNMLKTCPSCFFSVNLDDPLYKQRDISVRLVGVNNTDFGNYISSVEVMMRKKHENNETTLDNVIIDKNAFNTKANNFRMQYGWKGDNNREKWLNYEYKTKWVFGGGFSIETDWMEQEFSSIDMVPPLVKKDVYVELDPDFINEKKVRAAEVKIYFKNGDREDLRSVNLRANSDVLSKSVELILPKEVDNYDYEVTWFLKGKPPHKVKRTTYNYGSIYLDYIK